MSVEDVNVIDVVSIDKSGNAVLTISDHLEWDDANTHLLKLQNKINLYLDAIDNQSLYDSYPNARGRHIVINLVVKYWPNEDAKTFLQRTADVLQSAGYSFEFKYLKA
jgi:hypothetical protein